MASLVLRGSTYYAQFHDAVRRPSSRRLSTRTTVHKTALRLLAKAEDAYALGTWDPWVQGLSDLLRPARVPALTAGEGVERYLAEGRAGWSPYTVRNYTRVLRAFAHSAGSEAPLRALTSGPVAAFVSDPALAPSTLRSRLAVVGAFVRWAVRSGLLTEDVTAGVARPRPTPKLPRAVSDAELDAVCVALPDGKRWMEPAFRFAAVTGLRLGEIARLQWAHVDGETLRIERQKNGRAQTLPLSRAALAVLADLPRGGPSGYVFRGRGGGPRRVSSFVTYLGDSFRAARRAAGVERPVTPHGLRHAFCSRLAEAGKSAFVIQSAARHANVQTAARYVHIADGHLRAELDDVFD